MPRINLSDTGSTNFEKLLGHNKEILIRWCELEESLFKSNSLDLDLKEEVRKALAFSNKCHYWMSKGESDETITSVRVSLAKSFALLVAENHLEVDNEIVNVLKEEFSHSEISELCAFICFIIASQKFGSILDLR